MYIDMDNEKPDLKFYQVKKPWKKISKQGNFVTWMNYSSRYKVC